MFRLERVVTRCRTGAVRQEVISGMTSLSLARGPAAHLLHYVRGQWTIEDRSHWVRDVTFDEDHSQVRTGSIPEVMAALRNTTIGLLRAAGMTKIAATTRRLAAQPWEALALLGITPEN